jgi:hypothetical protein
MPTPAHVQTSPCQEQHMLSSAHPNTSPFKALALPITAHA